MTDQDKAPTLGRGEGFDNPVYGTTAQDSGPRLADALEVLRSTPIEPPPTIEPLAEPLTDEDADRFADALTYCIRCGTATDGVSATGHPYCGCREADADDADDADAPKKSQADRLVDLALDLYEVGISTRAEPFAVPKTGPRLATMFRGAGGSLRAQLAAAYRQEHGKVPSASALADALTAVEGMALASPPVDLFLRRAVVDGAVWIDLGRPTGEVIRVGADGWTVHGSAPVLFRRTPLTGEMPMPSRGGHIEALRDFVHVDDHGFDLLVGFIVSATIGDHPRPGVAFVGEQGTGKTTTAKTLVSLLDPSEAPVRAAPRDVTDWVVVADGSEVVALDNLSRISEWLSDSLCRAVTGESFPRRRLYSDGDIVISAFRRTLILTGIDLGAVRGDLLDRLIMLELARIPDDHRRPDRELNRAWEALHPAILGAFLDLTSEALGHLDDVTVDTAPRMADHARILHAIDTATGRDTVGAYLAATDNAQSAVIESDHVAAAVRDYVGGRGRWEGSATELLEALTEDAHGDRRPPKGWPTTAHHLSGSLRRSAPALRRAGFGVEFDRSGKNRRIEIWEEGIGKQASQASQASPDDADDADDARSELPSDGIAELFGEAS